MKKLINDIKNAKWIICIVFIYFVVTSLLFGTGCPFYAFTGIPCAGCGMTRAVWCLVTGKIMQSIEYNPVAVLWVCYIIYIVVERYIRNSIKTKGIKLLIVLCAVTMVVYFYRMLTMFPNTYPMLYNENSLLKKCTTLYK